MCFSVPKQIKSISNNRATTTDGLTISLGNLNVAPFDYVRVYGTMAVEKIGKKEALKIRRIIKSIA